MTRTTRAIAGLFALAAMTFSLAETVVAATCAADMAVHATAHTTAEAHHGSHDAPAPSAADHQTPSDDGPCPFGDVAAQLCGGFASLPAYSAAAALPTPLRVTDGFTEPAQPTHLFENALFHPPRA